MTNKITRLGVVVILFVFGVEVATFGQAVETEKFKIWKVPGIVEGAEFYFSPDGKSIIGNAKQPGDTIHQVYIAKIDGSGIRKINSKGADACSFYFPDGKHVIFTSTRDNLDLPAGNFSDPDNYPQGAELYIADTDGQNLRRLTNNKYYDAEVSVSPDGQWVLFTRQINGELDLWKVRPDGTDETQITKTVGIQEGGSFYLDDHKIIFRTWDRKEQGKRGLPMQIYTINDDGTDLKQITHDPGTNWAPYPAPDGEHFVYVRVVPPKNFELFLGDIKTGESQRLTFNDAFDGFPAFSPDGNYITFSSSRDSKPGSRALSQYIIDVSSLHLGKKENTQSQK
jgi:Tol biopolymer transport system component